MLTRLLDSALDLAVVPGYTRIGHAVRSRAWPDALPPMDGRTVLVTGATSGIGRAAAQAFAGLGARVLILARDPQRGERAAREIALAAGSGAEVVCVEGDLASLDSIHAAAEHVAATEPALHVLVNNAGVLPVSRELSVDGFELTFATNVLGMYALTERLVPLLEAGAPSRIINVSSGGMYTQRLDVDDLQTEHRDYDGPAVYARTKRAEIVLTEAWASRLAGRGIVAHAMHPGWVATPGVASSLPRFNRVMGPLLRTPQQGADTIVWLGAADEPGRSSGGFWHDRRRRPVDRVPITRTSAADAARLVEACRALSGEAAAPVTLSARPVA